MKYKIKCVLPKGIKYNDEVWCKTRKEFDGKLYESIVDFTADLSNFAVGIDSESKFGIEISAYNVVIKLSKGNNELEYLSYIKFRLIDLDENYIKVRPRCQWVSKGLERETLDKIYKEITEMRFCNMEEIMLAIQHSFKKIVIDCDSFLLLTFIKSYEECDMFYIRLQFDEKYEGEYKLEYKFLSNIFFEFDRY